MQIRALIEPIFVLPILFAGTFAFAQSAGTFTVVGDMTEARAGHTATLLYNGKVLLVGGLSFIYPPSAPSGAELYDPSTRTFTSTGAMIHPRSGHTATLLPDGTVLIAGGSAGTSAEIYDPATGMFTATGDMIAQSVFYPPAALLGNGKVFVANAGIAAQFYDPHTGAFALTAAYAGPGPASWKTATLLPDGRVLLIGSSSGGPVPSARTEIYDPRVDTFSLTGDPRAWNENLVSTTSLTNGKVLFIVDLDVGFVADAQVYDPATGIFSDAGYMSETHWGASSAILGDGTVLVAGGQGLNGPFDFDAELYAPGSGAFSLTGTMSIPRWDHTATPLPDGTVLLAGGSNDFIYPSVTASAEIYRPLSPVAAPLLFSLSGDGKGQGAIWHAATGQVVLPGNPAVAGEVLSMYTTGLIDGGLIPPQIAIGGQLAEILYFGGAPGYPGYDQVNLRLPGGVAPGPAVPVHLTYFGRPSNEVTIGVQ